MATHAEKCPVCEGRGLVEGADDLSPCHGCDGKGWVTVGDGRNYSGTHTASTNVVDPSSVTYGTGRPPTWPSPTEAAANTAANTTEPCCDPPAPSRVTWECSGCGAVYRWEVGTQPAERPVLEYAPVFPIPEWMLRRRPVRVA